MNARRKVFEEKDCNFVTQHPDPAAVGQYKKPCRCLPTPVLQETFESLSVGEEDKPVGAGQDWLRSNHRHLKKDCRRSISAILTWVTENVKIGSRPLNSIGNQRVFTPATKILFISVSPYMSASEM